MFMKITNLLIVIFLFFLVSCEDDPILEPQTQKEETGSYGNLSLPNNDNIKSKNPKIL